MQQLQQLQQMQQMQQLQQMQQAQIQQQAEPSDNNNVVMESQDTKESSESFSSSITEMLKDPVMILVLYIAISHPTTQSILGKWIPNLCPGEEEELGLTNLLVQGALLVTIYFAFKLFIVRS
jgi:23S rRNA pseudoU1915 N3-methylase RlmH